MYHTGLEYLRLQIATHTTAAALCTNLFEFHFVANLHSWGDEYKFEDQGQCEEFK